MLLLSFKPAWFSPLHHVHLPLGSLHLRAGAAFSRLLSTSSCASTIGSPAFSSQNTDVSQSALNSHTSGDSQSSVDQAHTLPEHSLSGSSSQSCLPNPPPLLSFLTPLTPPGLALPPPPCTFICRYPVTYRLGDLGLGTQLCKSQIPPQGNEGGRHPPCGVTRRQNRN